MRVIFPLFIAAVASLIVLASAAFAQERDSVFKDYDSYSTFLDTLMMKRDFVPLVQTLGGRDEFTDEELTGINQQLLNVFPLDFRNVTVFREEDLGGGIRQEGRMYWTGEQYAFYYALMHQRADEFIILSFFLNSNSAEIIARF